MTAITERYLQDQVRKLCGDLGFIVQHLEDSRRSWVPGWPDLEIIGGRGIIYRELKGQQGPVSPDQRRIGRIISTAGGDWAIWRPRDLLSGRIASELTALSRHGAKHES